MKEKITHNQSSVFILPFIGRPKTFYEPEFIDCYLSDPDNLSTIDNLLYVVMRNSGSISYPAKVLELQTNKVYRGEYILFDDYTVYIYEIPPMFTKDFKLVLEGKYSKLSDIAKLSLLAGKTSPELLAQILYRDDKLRIAWEKRLNCSVKGELWSKINLQKEELDRDKLLALKMRNKMVPSDDF